LWHDKAPEPGITAIATQWAAATAVSASGGDSAAEPKAIPNPIDRIRKAAETLRGARRTVTAIKSSLEGLQETLGGLRTDVLDQVDDLDRLLCRTSESRGLKEVHS